jgi:hypothetical protein
LFPILRISAFESSLSDCFLCSGAGNEFKRIANELRKKFPNHDSAVGSVIFGFWDKDLRLFDHASAASRVVLGFWNQDLGFPDHGSAVGSVIPTLKNDAATSGSSRVLLGCRLNPRP